MAQQDSPLLALPAELRQQIYLHALVSQDDIDYSVRGSRPTPPLLVTCHQVRKEALEMYFTVNSFSFWVRNMDPDDLPKIPRRIIKKMKQVDTPVMDIRNWKNLVTWLQRVHEGGIERGYQAIDNEAIDPDGEVAILDAIFKMVYDLRDLPWDRVAGQIKHFRTALVTQNDEWE